VFGCIRFPPIVVDFFGAIGSLEFVSSDARQQQRCLESAKSFHDARSVGPHPGVKVNNPFIAPPVVLRCPAGAVCHQCRFQKLLQTFIEMLAVPPSPRSEVRMPRSNAAVSKRALARIQRLCCLGIGSEMLMPDLLREVMRLVPSRHGQFCWAGTNAEIANSYGTFPLSGVELFFREFHRTPRETAFIKRLSDPKLWSAPVLQHRQTLCTDNRTFLRSELYNVLWRPADIDEPIRMIAREAGRTYGVLSVFRAVGEAPFGSDAVRLLASIARFAAHAMTRAELREEAFVESEDHGLFVADIGGTVYHADFQTQRLLMMALTPRWSPATGCRPREPAPEIARLCRTLTATANGHIGHPPPVLRLRNPWGEFVLRAYWLGPTDGAEQTRHIGITIERRVPRVLALHRRVEELPLTGREKQLCLLLGYDRSRQDLADTMGVSAGTVITHQSSIYAKLGVHSRANSSLRCCPGDAADGADRLAIETAETMGQIAHVNDGVGHPPYLHTGRSKHRLFSQDGWLIGW
jgi:DNA-binding CsgD family transcriptional regulator